jgi:hypothetical protein
MSFLAFLDMVALKLTFRRPDVSAYESEAREGMDNIADAIRTLAGVMASCAAACHTDTLDNQRNMAGVIYADAQERFGDVLKKLDDKTRRELEAWLAGLCRTKR